MAPRRSRKVVKVPQNNVYTDLTLNKIMCPICRTILIEPVTLPCHHNFCLSCFDSTMANANLVCPLCRIRVGSWYRKAKKLNALVNTELWKAIKEQFAVHVKNKHDGVDELFDDEEQPLIKLAPPGAIRDEYEKQKAADEADLMKQRDLEAQASEELIRKLAAEDEFERSVAEEKVRVDRELAKQIAKNLWSGEAPGPSSMKKQQQQQGPLDRFVRRRTRREAAVAKEAEISDSSDCIESECRFFKPIDRNSIPASKAVSPIRVVAQVAVARSLAVLGTPQGSINFRYNPTNSAFAIVRNITRVDTTNKKVGNNGRRNGTMCTTVTTLTKRPPETTTLIIGGKRAKKAPSPRRLRRRPSKHLEEHQKRTSSPPCYGFKANTATDYFDKHCVLVNNNNFEEVGEGERKRQQEAADLEFAKKLQVELNGYGRYTTRLGCNKRQLTLDELIKAQSRVGL